MKARPQTTTASDKHSHDRRSNKHHRAKKKPTATKTILLPGGIPAYVKVTVAREEPDMGIERRIISGFLANDSIFYDDGLVLSKEIDGFPSVEISDRLVEQIEYIDPDEKPVIKKLESLIGKSNEKPDNSIKEP